ncbi:hypothetical protein L0Y69_02100 [bacterium]|nr:hypothetical protein [bacterium]
MITRYEHKGLVWLDVESPTREEVAELSREFEIHPLVSEELMAPSQRPKVEAHEGSLYLVLHFPAFEHHHGQDHRQEVDFVVGKKFLLTVRYEEIDVLHKFSKEFEANSILDRSNFGEHAGFLFYLLIKKLYRALSYELEHVESRLREAEGKIFTGEEEKMVVALSHVHRIVLEFRQTLRTHEEILRSFERAGARFFGEEFVPYLDAILGEFRRVSTALESHRETLFELRATNDSLLSAKQSGVMRTLTAITFATFPPAFIAWMFSMRAEHMPIIGTDGDFWIIFVLMILSTLLTFWFFAYKKWI